MTQRSKLTQMKLRSIHMVDEGDNKGAYILMKKTKPQEDIDDETSEDEIQAAINKAISDEQTSDEAVVGSDIDTSASNVQTIPVKFTANDAGDVIAQMPDGTQTVVETAKNFIKRIFSTPTETPLQKDFNADLERQAMYGFVDQCYSLVDTYLGSIEKALYDYDDDGGSVKTRLEKNTQQFIETLNGRLQSYDTEEMAKRGRETSKEELQKKRPIVKNEASAEAEAEESGDVDTTVDVDNTERGEDVAGKLDQAKIDKIIEDMDDDAQEYFKGVIEKAKQAETSVSPELVGLDEEEREMLKGASAAQIAIYKRQQADIAKLRTEKEEEQYITKATRLFKSLPMSAQEFGPVMRRLEKGETTKEDGEYILDLLKSADKMKETGGIFDTLGELPDPTRIEKGGSAKERLIRKAQAFGKEKGINPEVALVEVSRLAENAELVAEYYEELAEEADRG